ncbi:hypothetical protein EIP91_007582 [Steccherinum ochraceum]|uniref:Uncharacterized protein n=1 Tax=Steccherinum ochraceum TaxID=92696 RepID=A0A4R0RP46_9APHY|nr:hypothetical protein EIP91_007582 [Steccherinum ochraceum]
MSSTGIVNRTIDDQFGDEVTGLQVTYTPAALWAQGNGCSGCASHPNSSLVFNETWHDGTYTPSHGDDPLSFAFKFNGTAVYVFNVLPRLTLTNVNITLDGTFATNFTHFQNVSILEQYTYNVPIFAVDSLQYGEHTVAVTAVGSNTTSLLFDYAVYTTNISDTGSTTAPPPGQAGDSSQHHKTNIGAIVGGVVGGVALIAVIILAGLFYRRRARRGTRMTGSLQSEPFVALRPSHQATSSDSLSSTPDKLSSIPVIIRNAAPSSQGDPSSEGDATSSASEDTSSVVPLQEQLQFFRAELEALRARSAKSPSKGVKPSRSKSLRENGSSINSGGTNSSRAVSSLASEVAHLRAQMAELKTQQSDVATSPTLSNQASSDDFQREISMLREEIEELRMHHLEPLPEYTPPPSALPSSPSSRPLPSAPWQS